MIPDSLIAPGLVCAVIFPEDQNWHRGVVTGRNAEGFVQVSILVSLTLLHLEQPKTPWSFCHPDYSRVKH